MEVDRGPPVPLRLQGIRASRRQSDVASGPRDGAHGYLLDEFLWAATNRRKEIYGGSVLAGHARSRRPSEGDLEAERRAAMTTRTRARDRLANRLETARAARMGGREAERRIQQARLSLARSLQ